MSTCSTGETGSQRDERRRRYLAKQERFVEAVAVMDGNILPAQQLGRQEESIHNNKANNNDSISCAELWINDNRPMCTLVTIGDVNMVKQRRQRLMMVNGSGRKVDDNDRTRDYDSDDTGSVGHKNEKLSRLEFLDDILSPYFDLRNRDVPAATKPGNESRCCSSSNLQQRFIAEGTETIRLLLQQQQQEQQMQVVAEKEENMNSHQSIQIESIFLKPNLFFESPVYLQHNVDVIIRERKKESSLLPSKQATPPFQILLASEETLSAVAGFTVSRGCLACGYIPHHRDEAWLLQFLQQQLLRHPTKQLRLLALDGITDTANAGSMIRCASAMGIQAVILSSDCCDAWYRRAIRVSMGHVFRVPIVRVTTLSQTIVALSQPPYTVLSYAAIVDDKAKITLHNLKAGTFQQSFV
jgi:SpoU rRNA Methylase family